MRGSDAASGALFSYVDMEARVPVAHPLRTIQTIVNEVLDALDTAPSSTASYRRILVTEGVRRQRLELAI